MKTRRYIAVFLWDRIILLKNKDKYIKKSLRSKINKIAATVDILIILLC